MSHSHPAGLLAAYNSLTDKHLVGYFNNARIRRHLLRSGLRYHQLEIKKKLETLARKEQVQQFKGEHTRKFIENNMPILSPHPPAGPKTSRGHSVLIDERYSSPLTPTAPRPYTAPGIMRPPIRLQPLPNNHAGRSVSKRTLRSRSKTSLLENEVPFPIGGKKSMLKFRNSMDFSQRIFPYQLPYIENYLRSIPPPSPPLNGKITRENRSETWRRRRFRPTTAPTGLEPLFTRDPGRINKPSLHSNALITMIYLGKSVHLSYGDTAFQDEIKIYQQHCGGENLCVYTGTVLEKDTFQFISKRHHGFPFSLTFFLNGIQVNRLSSCCEYKHRKGSRLGGKRGYFGFVCVEKASPCYKCIIAMGLDRKPPLAKPRKEKNNEKREGKQRHERGKVTSRRDENMASPTCVPTIHSAQEINTGLPEVRSAMEEMEQKCSSGQDVWDDDQENIVKYEYEEDFEADEEQQAETANTEVQADDQMNGVSKSPSDDEKDNLDPEKESDILSQRAPEIEDNMKDEDDGYSESEWEEDKKDTKTSSSVSSMSHPPSSESEDESAEHDQETHTTNERGYESSDEVESSCSPELSENDEPGKLYHPMMKNLENEVKDQKIIKTNVKTQPLSADESYKNGLGEEMEKTAQGITENLSMKSRKLASAKQKEKIMSKVWEATTAKVDRKAGHPEVDEGVGQIISEALAPACQCHSDIKSGVSSTDEGEKPMRKLEIDPTGALKKNFMVAEREAVNPNKEAKQITPDTHAQRMKETMEECEVSQLEEAGTAEGKEDVALWEKAGVTEDSLAEQNPRAEQSALAEQFALGPAIETEAEAEGDKNLGLEEQNSTAAASASTSENLSEDKSDEEQPSLQFVLESEEADSEGMPGSEEAFITNLALSSVSLQEEAALRERATLEMGEAESGEAEREDGSKKPDVAERDEEVPTESENVGSVENAERVSVRSSFEYAMLGGEEPARERKEEMETITPLSTSTGEIDTWEMDISESSSEELSREGTVKQELQTKAESSREDNRQEMFPEELKVDRERQATQPNTPQCETRSEREEVTRSSALKDEDTLKDEQKLEEEDRATVKGVRSEKEKKGSHNEMESHTEESGSTEAIELTEDTGLLEDPLKERMETMFEATCGFEKSREQVIVLSKEEERLSEVRETEHKDRAEFPGQNVILPEQGKEAHHGKRPLGMPESEPAGQGQAREATIAATGEADASAAKDQDCLERLERREEGGTAQGHTGQDVMVVKMTQEDVPKGSPTMAGNFRGEAMDEEYRNSKCTLGTGVGKDSNVERSDIMMDADGDQGVAKTATEKRGVWVGSKSAEGETVTNQPSSFSEVAGEKLCQAGKEALGETAAVERVATEEIALRSEEVSAEEGVTVTPTADTGRSLPHPEANFLSGQILIQGQDQEGGDTQHTGSRGEEADMESPYERQESGSTEESRKGSSPDRESELSRVRLGAVATSPMKPGFPGTQEKQEDTVQEQNERADVS
ncbi:glutamate-rich protein 3 isoform X2 [Dipodomys merriami]|uniref:glutamate-rich protein 3 isoform X2 n=1 Tax=Dipodomys merriami TaxID=94247 RepID=UPI003855D3D4